MRNGSFGVRFLQEKTVVNWSMMEPLRCPKCGEILTEIRLGVYQCPCCGARFEAQQKRLEAEGLYEAESEPQAKDR